MSRETWPSTWRSSLIAYLDRQERRAFAYGENDCLLMTSGAVATMTGIDHAAAYRGRYRTLAGGRRVIGMTPLEKVASLFVEIHPVEALDGDIAAMPVGRDWTFGVLVGAHFYVLAETGLAILPRGGARKAFRVE